MDRTDIRLSDMDLGGLAGAYGSYVSLSTEAAVSLGSMEGLLDGAARPAPWPMLLPGYLLAAVTAMAAYLLPKTAFTAQIGFDRLSSTMLAILLGVALRNLLPLPPAISAGCKDIIRRVIPLAIVCIGAGLDFSAIAGIGLTTLFITIVMVLLGFALAYCTARWLGLNHTTSLLLGSGTAICGSSAIAATAPLVEADDEEMLLSIGTVNLVGLLAMLALPIAAVAMELGADAFGVWCGTSIHAVPQVIAAADALSDLRGATTIATLVKMGRVALLAPLVFILAIAYARRHAADTSGGHFAHIRYAKLVPWFIWVFIAAALLKTLGLLPILHFNLLGAEALRSVDTTDLLTSLGKIMLALAMAAIGLGVNLRSLLSVGGRALAAGIISSILLAASSLALIRLL